MTTTAATPPADLSSVGTDELRARRGSLAQGAQGAVLEGLAIDDDDARELASLDAELRRRGALS